MLPKTTLDQAYHFGMFMMKAVLDGRGSELIDLGSEPLPLSVTRSTNMVWSALLLSRL